MICFVGTLPPPVYGMAQVSAQMVEAFAAETRVAAFSTSPGRFRGLAGHAIKLAKSLAGALFIVAARLRGARLLYRPADDGLGGLYVILHVLVARLVGMRVCIHHHSFLYLNRATGIMAMIVRLAGAGGCHIVLCERMGDLLTGRYATRAEIVVIGNVVEIPPQRRHDVPRDGPITIGILANLTFEKGVGPFLDLVEQSLGAGLDVAAVLAGPAHAPDVREAIEQAMARHPGRIAWRGPVYGEAKDSFFRDIDLFAFPTLYPSEAYPLVILEALAAGVPVIALDRGCIGAFRKTGACIVADAPEGFIAQAKILLDGWSKDRSTMASASVAARDWGLELVSSNLSARQRWIGEVVRDAQNA